MRICFIGNSHLGSIKLAMDSMGSQFPEVEPTFFASASSGLRSLTLSGRHLVCNSPQVANQLRKISGGRDTIDLDAYDRIVLVGLGLGFVLAGQVYNSYRTASMAWQGAPYLVSDSCFATAVAQGIASSLAIKIAEKIHSVRQDAVTIIPNPLLSENILTQRIPKMNKRRPDQPMLPVFQRARVWQGLHQSGDVATLWKIYSAALGALPAHLKIQQQPSRTIAHKYFTLADYSRGALRLDLERKQPAIDVAHMNADYGCEVLREVFAAPEVASRTACCPA